MSKHGERLDALEGDLKGLLDELSEHDARLEFVGMLVAQLVHGPPDLEVDPETDTPEAPADAGVTLDSPEIPASAASADAVVEDLDEDEMHVEVVTIDGAIQYLARLVCQTQDLSEARQQQVMGILIPLLKEMDAELPALLLAREAQAAAALATVCLDTGGAALELPAGVAGTPAA